MASCFPWSAFVTLVLQSGAYAYPILAQALTMLRGTNLSLAATRKSELAVLLVLYVYAVSVRVT